MILAACSWSIIITEAAGGNVRWCGSSSRPREGDALTVPVFSALATSSLTATRSIVISVSVCMSAHSHISETQTSQNF